MTLVDTAGLRDSLDAVEIEGMRRARDELARADLAILVSTERICSWISIAGERTA